MKNKYLPQLYGVVKDYHPRMIPENKVADCENVIFKQGRVRRRYGYATLGPYQLNGAINGIAYYEQVRLGSRYTLVFTSRDAYLYDTTTGSFTPISLNYNAGTARVNSLAVTGVSPASWLNASWTLTDVYTMKFGTNNASTNAINFTGTVSRYTSLGSVSTYSMKSVALDSTTSIIAYTRPNVAYARVVTKSGTSVTVGTEYTVISTCNYGISVAALSSTSFIIVSKDLKHVYATVCTISGTTITAGSTTTIVTYTGYEYVLDDVPVVAMSSTVAVSAFCHYNESTNTYSLRTVSMSISGTTVSYGAIDIQSASTSSDLAICKKSSSAFIVSLTTNVYEYTISGTTITYGYTSSILSGYGAMAIVQSSSSRFLLAARQTSTEYPYAILVDDSGSAFTVVTTLQLSTTATLTGHIHDLKAIDTSNFLFIENNATIYARMITISGDTLSQGTAYAARSFSTLYTDQSVACAVFSTSQSIMFHSDGTSSYYGKVSLVDTNITTKTMAIASYLLSSISALTNLYVGLELTATFLAAGTRIKSIDWSGSTITIDRAATGDATAGSISADISRWYTIHSVDSATGITLHATGSFTGTTTTSSAVVTGITDTSVLHVGMGVSGTDIPSNTYILSIDSATQITMSANATTGHTAMTISTGLCITSGHEVNYIINLCFNGADDDYWSFAYPYLASAGDKILCATNGVDPILKWDGSGAVEILGGTPPTTAKYIGYFGAAMYEHLVAAWTTDTGNNLPQTIELANAGTPETWGGTYYDLLQKNDEIIGIEILKSRLVIYKKKSISLAYPTPDGGNTDPLDIEQDVIIDIEIPVGRTVVNFGDYHLFLGMDNVYRFNGMSLEPIGTEVINTMKNEWNGQHMNHAFAFAIPNENLYVIFIPTLEIRDEYDNVVKRESDYPDKAYVFNYAENTWTIWTFPIDPVTLVSQQFTCAAFVNKLYAPTVADIDALNRSYADMTMRWSDLIAYSNTQSLLLGDINGYVYEMRDVYDTDNGTAIDASFTTRDYPLNDPVHVFMLLEAVIGFTEILTGDIHIRASIDFGATWSTWIPVDQAGDTAYVEYVANFMQKGLQVRFEIANIDGADFEVESIMIGYNDELGHKK